MGGLFSVLYGFAVYVVFLATFLYTFFFFGRVFVPKTIDSGTQGPLGEALIVNTLLLGLFAVQHSVMARKGFKRWWMRIVPPAVERSTYVLASSLALALLVWQWRPIPQTVWVVHDPALALALQVVYWLGLALVLLATFLINHFELFGLRQVFTRLLGREMLEQEFRTPLLYRWVRHPLYLGFLLAFWAAPVMSAGHLLFAVACTGYIFVGIWFEECDLVEQFGERYRSYRARVGMLLPRLFAARR
jgi:protein-S-isoprenylcysteine O-methyltransferase Ste14